MACFIVTKGPDEQVGKCYQLARRTLAAGRHPAREIQLLDPKVSRKHFLVKMAGGHHVIIETQPKNPLWVNGVQVGEKQLEDGDQIEVGDTLLIYYVSDRANQADALLEHRDADRQNRENQTLTGG